MKKKFEPCFLLLFLLSFTTISSSSFSSSNFEALLAFKHSSYDNSKSLTSWSNSTHPCSGSWLGVTCKNTSNRLVITRIVLENLGLTGSIKPFTQLTHLRLLSLKHNNLCSVSAEEEEIDFTPWNKMKLLYLSYNNFSTGFPSGVSSLVRLRRLDLSHNNFSGSIPFYQLAQLPHLLTLRLESNSFMGKLPATIVPFRPPSLIMYVQPFSTLKDFNVSSNHLLGKIPEYLSSFPSSTFAANEHLCGEPLPEKCLSNKNEPIPIKVPPIEHGGKRFFSRRTMVLILIIYACAVVLVGVAIFYLCRKRKLGNGVFGKKKDGEVKKREYGMYDEMVCFDGSKGFRVDDLLKGSAEMLGKGSVGTTYKVMMDNGDVVVVKRTTRERKKKKEIEGLLRKIGGLRNNNIVSLRGYYCSTDELLFVYDFLPNGSLHSLLHGNHWEGRTSLDWNTRLNFALGIADGLAFLHNTCKPKLSHGHVTSNNIIIDREGNACLSDVALNQLFVASTQLNPAYTAPELMPNTHYSRKPSNESDVYSFGLILLEILTGKLANGEGETSLVKWVQSVVPEKWNSEVFDFELSRYKEMEQEMVALLQVALLCLTASPRDRPKMSIVRKMVEDIKVGRSSIGTKSSNEPISYYSSSSLSEDIISS